MMSLRLPANMITRFLLVLFLAVFSIHTYAQTPDDYIDSDYALETRMRAVKSIFNVSEKALVLKAKPELSFQQACPQMYGLIPVKKDGKWGVIDSTGSNVIPFAYDSIYQMHTIRERMQYNTRSIRSLWPLMVFEKKTQPQSFIVYNADSRKPYEKEFSEVWMEQEEPSYRYHLFGKCEGKKAVIGADGFIVPPQFDNVELFGVSRGSVAQFLDGTYFKVRKDWKYGIYKAGAGLITQKTYDHFSLWKVTRNGEVNYSLFLDGFTFFTQDGKTGVMDSTGRELVAAEYDEIERGLTPDSYITLVKDGKIGFYSLNENRIVIPFTYPHFSRPPKGESYGYYESKSASDFYSRFNKGYCVIAENERTGVINRKGELVVPMQENMQRYIYKGDYLYSKPDSSEYWSLTYLPTGKTLHKKLWDCPLYSEFAYPVFDSAGIVVQDNEKLKLLSNEGKALYTFSAVGCEGPFKIHNANVLKDGDKLFEVSKDGKVSKINVIKHPFADEGVSEMMVASEDGDYCIIENPMTYKMEKRALPQGIKWRKKQDGLSRHYAYDFGIIEKDKKYGLYHFRSGVIAVQPVYKSLKDIEMHLDQSPFEE